MNTSFYLVAGLGKTGYSIAHYLQRRGLQFAVFDTRSRLANIEDFHRDFPGVEIFLGTFPETFYSKLTAIITSPGVSLDEPFIQKAYEFNIPVYGDIECLARECTQPMVAITGTNGKSTVTTLLGKMARVSGRIVAVAGNIGAPVLDLLDDAIPYDLWVLELSSFQLDLTFSLKPMAATILNLTPDHLDRHVTMEAYLNAKQKIYDHADTMIYNRDDAQTRPYPQYILPSSRVQHYGLNSPSENNWGILSHQGVYYLACGAEPVIAVDSLHLKGQHNWQNALAACALAESIGISREVMVKVLQSFTGLPHRSQWIRTLDGVDWINDSKGTNVGATVSAITGIGGATKGKIILIAGGIGKGADFSDLRMPISDYVRSVVLIGQDAEIIKKEIMDIVPVHDAITLDSAIALAKKEAKPGDVVLLSPACASQDMFQDFNHRGDTFAAAVNAL